HISAVSWHLLRPGSAAPPEFLPQRCATTPIPAILACRDPPPSPLYTLSLHDALPISYYLAKNHRITNVAVLERTMVVFRPVLPRSEEHTSELQSRRELVCRLLLEKKTRALSMVWRR